MRVFYKSLLFIMLWNALFLLLAFLLLEIHFLIPVIVLLLFFNLFLALFTHHFIKKNYPFSHFPPDDPYGVSALFEEFKKKNPDLKVQLLKSQELSSLYWSGFEGTVIALSEDFLENFSQEELNCFLAYAFKKTRSGDLFFLSLLSSFLYLILKPVFVLDFPLFLKRGKEERGFLQKGLIRLLSLATKPLFYKIDRQLFKKTEQKRNQAWLLWNLESFTRLQKQKIPLFLSSLCLIKPFSGHFKEEKSPSLQPSVKNRLKKLINTYPP